MLVNKENPEKIYFVIYGKYIDGWYEKMLLGAVKKVSNNSDAILLYQDHFLPKKLMVITSRELTDGEKESFRKECSDDFDDISFWA